MKDGIKYTTYKEWFLEIKWLKDKVILPDGTRVSKDEYVTKGNFNIDGFNSLLFKMYNKQYHGK